MILTKHKHVYFFFFYNLGSFRNLTRFFLFCFADAVLLIKIKILKVREEMHGLSEAELYNKM